MSNSESDPSDYVDETNLETPHANQRRETIDHIKIENDAGPDELAIFDAEDGTSDDEWISATGESFESLEDAR